MDHTGSYGNGGRLAEKLRSEYRNRGVAAKGYSAPGQKRRAQKGWDSHGYASAGSFDGEKRRGYRADDRDPYGKGRRSVGRDSYYDGFESSHMGREEAAEEIRVARKKIPAGFLLGLVFCTVMIMFVILSVAQIYQESREISGLERDVASLKETIYDLELKLDEKNDIRLIEQMATSSLGMVKEDSLQRKYISLSEGERVDLIEAPSAAGDSAEGQGMGSMLSSFLSALGDLFGYFK